MTAGVLQIGVMMSNATKKRIAEIVEQYKQAKGIEDGRVDVHDFGMDGRWTTNFTNPICAMKSSLLPITFSRHFREEFARRL